MRTPRKSCDRRLAASPGWSRPVEDGGGRARPRPLAVMTSRTNWSYGLSEATRRSQATRCRCPSGRARSGLARSRSPTCQPSSRRTPAVPAGGRPAAPPFRRRPRGSAASRRRRRRADHVEMDPRQVVGVVGQVRRRDVELAQFLEHELIDEVVLGDGRVGVDALGRGTTTRKTSTAFM